MTSPRIGVVGAGYVGLTTAVCMADRGLDTICVEVDVGRLAALRAGSPSIEEPELPELLQRGLGSGGLRFSDDYSALADRDAVFVCVPTPSGADGSADLMAVESAIDRLADVLPAAAVVALKSTVPVGTTRRLDRRLSGRGIRVVSTPEFLRESHAIKDFRHPDRIVIGAEDAAAADVVESAYGAAEGTRVLRMSPESAELAKYASNAFLAVKLSYANSLARLCSRVGGDVGDVAGVMGADTRIGMHFLAPGPGWGGSCLPKDTAALLHIGGQAGLELREVRAACATNDDQCEHIAETVRRLLGGSVAGFRITAFGLTFKAHTSDVRDSPALRVCARLSSEGAQVSGYDPLLARIDPRDLARAGVVGIDDAHVAAKDAQAIVLLTEWPQFRALDWGLVAEHAPGAVVVDTRNALDSVVVRAEGLRYVGNGKADGY